MSKKKVLDCCNFFSPCSFVESYENITNNLVMQEIISESVLFKETHVILKIDQVGLLLHN